MDIRYSYIPYLGILTFAACAEQTTEDLSSLDLNGDNVPDIKIEYEGDTYFQRVDRNFDSNVDESHRNTLENKIINSQFDSDFDGRLETIVFCS